MVESKVISLFRRHSMEARTYIGRTMVRDYVDQDGNIYQVDAEGNILSLTGETVSKEEQVWFNIPGKEGSENE